MSARPLQRDNFVKRKSYFNVVINGVGVLDKGAIFLRGLNFVALRLKQNRLDKVKPRRVVEFTVIFKFATLANIPSRRHRNFYRRLWFGAVRSKFLRRRLCQVRRQRQR